ncbi:hypothetical protein [Microbispora sp. NPDC049125]|uniref:hypothetical protein n=1 Tax=Microbispora sp. NPDC049125 TaxID=3154929 RepID=UPI003466B009
MRFHLDREAVRITYWLAKDRRIILLTVFRKQRMREPAESSVRGVPCGDAPLRLTRRMRSERHGRAQGMGREAS